MKGKGKRVRGRVWTHGTAGVGGGGDVGAGCTDEQPPLVPTLGGMGVRTQKKASDKIVFGFVDDLEGAPRPPPRAPAAGGGWAFPQWSERAGAACGGLVPDAAPREAALGALRQPRRRGDERLARVRLPQHSKHLLRVAV